MYQVLVESSAMQAPPTVVLQIEVDLDLSSCDTVAAQLAALAAAPGYDRVVLHVPDLFVSARGLAVLADSVLAAAGRGRRWAVAGLSRVVLQRFAAEWFPAAPMFCTLQDALGAVRRGAVREPDPGAQDARRAEGDGGVAVGPAGEATAAAAAAQLGTVLAAATHVLGVDDAGVMLLDQHDELRILGSCGAAAALLGAAQVRLGAGPAIDAVIGRRTVAVADLEGTYAELWGRVGEADGRAAPAPHAVLAVPLRIDGDVVGNLDVLRVRPHPWTKREIAAVEAYAGTVALLLRQGAVRDPGPAATGHD